MCVDELGLKSPNGPFLSVTGKSWRTFLSCRPCHVFFIELRIFSFSLPPMRKCISLLFSPLLYSPNRIKLKKKPNFFFKV